jgi:PAS domain S-box-containing protein
VQVVGTERRRSQRLADQAHETGRARELLRRQLRAVTETATVGLLLSDELGRCTFMNPAAEQLLGLTLSDIRQRGMHQLIHHHRPDGSTYPPDECPISNALAGGHPARGEETFIRPDGTFYPVAYAVTPIVSDAVAVGAVVELREIGEEKRVAEEREQLLESERTTNRVKDEFLAMLGHELRNPIGAIMTAADVLRHVDPTDPRAAQLNAIIRRQTAHLNRLIDDLLDVARVASGKVVLARRPVDLGRIVQHAVDVLRETGKLEQHQVVLHLDAGWVDGDVARLEQVTTNLLLNAIKYTPADGHIDVRVELDTNAVRLRVLDDGAGIAPELLPRVFDPFVQSEQSLDRSSGGLGIGLTLVRRLVEHHGGSVEARSAGPGTGTEMIVSLRRVAAPDRTTATAAADTSTRDARRVLIVEDNDDAREAVRLLLETAGHEVHEANDGRAGLQAALDTRPEVAIVDLGLPGIDGFELARRLRATAAGARIRLVALTGYGQPEDRARAAEAGFDAHLVKPVDERRLLAALTDHGDGLQ